MKLQEYEDIIDRLTHLKRTSYFEVLEKEYPDVPEGTLQSIISQYYQKLMKKVHWLHTNKPNIDKYFQRVQEAFEKKEPVGVLVRLADEIDFSPCLLARAILYQFYKDATKPHITHLMRQTRLISPPQLAVEVQKCNVLDDFYGPYSDVIKRAAGLKYEDLLMEELKKRDVVFWGESELRQQGYDKTPDVKLQIPIGGFPTTSSGQGEICEECTAINGRPINWIESKASFGDPESHAGYLETQYWSYQNRFGPGLVIYWLGYVEEVDRHREQGIMLADHLPESQTPPLPS